MVSDGRALIETALRLKPEVIVADIAMPILNGLDAARRIKELSPNQIHLSYHASTIQTWRLRRSNLGPSPSS